MNKNKWIWLLVVAAVAFFFGRFSDKQPTAVEPTSQTQSAAQSSRSNFEQVLQDAYEQRRSNVQIAGEGVVKKTLPDDNKGSRHQRFILQLKSGQTVLVAHNIDLAEKIKGLKKGDTVAFYGEYEWSEQGGVIHWTHHDPKGSHADGWLKHNGKVYR